MYVLERYIIYVLNCLCHIERHNSVGIREIAGRQPSLRARPEPKAAVSRLLCILLLYLLAVAVGVITQKTSWRPLRA